MHVILTVLSWTARNPKGGPRQSEQLVHRTNIRCGWSFDTHTHGHFFFLQQVQSSLRSRRVFLADPGKGRLKPGCVCKQTNGISPMAWVSTTGSNEQPILQQQSFLSSLTSRNTETRLDPRSAYNMQAHLIKGYAHDARKPSPGV